MPASLRVDHLSYDYGGGVGLHDVSLQVMAGEVVALVGPNGAGKSTLLRCCAGWTRVADASVHIFGQDMRWAERAIRRQLVLVPDTPRFWPDLTAWEHLRFIAGANRLRHWMPRARDLMTAFGLGDRQEASPLEYSRGMSYKLALVMALLVRPPLLLLDEPFGPLDPDSAQALWEQVRALAREGASVLLSCHQLPPDAIPDRFVVLAEGRVAASGTPAELGGATPEAVLRRPSADA